MTSSYGLILINCRHSHFIWCICTNCIIKILIKCETIRSTSNRIVQQLFQAPVIAHLEKVNRAERDCDVIYTVASFYTQSFCRVLSRPLQFCVQMRV